MEFSDEGIPVGVVRPGEDGFEFWALAVDRASRPMWSDDDIWHRPNCTDLSKQQQERVRGNFYCWTTTGYLGPGCLGTLEEETQESGFRTLGCRL